MEPGSLKHYGVHGFHSRKFLDTYCSSKPEMAFPYEGVSYLVEKFYQAFATGDFKGDLLIDFSIGPVIHHLYGSKGCFKDIVILKPTDHCVVEVKKWIDSRTGAFDWSHCSALAKELAGKSDQCDQSKDDEIELRAVITQVLKFDLKRKNLTDPVVLPQADCLVIIAVLGAISKTLEDFVINLRRFSMLLKPGGGFMYYGLLNATYYMVAGEKYHCLKYSESDLRSILSNEGFIISHFEVSQKQAKSDLADFESVVFCTGYKQKV